jgi:hypothetical protein
MIIYIVLLCSSTASALSTDDMLNLKKSGIAEETIVLMVESSYGDVEKILHLKAAGFREENIRAVIKAESKTGAGSERIDKTTTANVKILRYLVFRGKPVLQKSQTIDKAVLSLVDGSNLKLEWKEPGGLGLIEQFRPKGFKNPFYWTINAREDTLIPSHNGYPYLLKSGLNHKGMPETDETHYWLLFIDPGDSAVIELIKSVL